MNNNDQQGRRSFLKKAAIGSLGGLSLPSIVEASLAADKPKKINIDKNAVILFQGDSITDAGRNRSNTRVNDADAMGRGYACFAAADLLQQSPDKGLAIYNRGVSGNKVYQLAERWDQDALSLKPAVLSILIGVNDYWHLRNGSYKGTIRNYRDDYKALLERTRARFPEIKLILGEPFAIPGTAVSKAWFPAFHEYRYIAKELADLYQASFISYQTVFDEAVKRAPEGYWSQDGVHPSMAGARLMSLAWLEAIKK